MQPPTRQPGRSSGRTSVSFSGSKVAPVDGLDNGALLHLAEVWELVFKWGSRSSIVDFENQNQQNAVP